MNFWPVFLLQLVHASYVILFNDPTSNRFSTAPHQFKCLKQNQFVLGSSVSVNVASATAGQIFATPQKICRSISKAVGKKFAENSFSASFFDKEETSKKRKTSSKASTSGDDPYYSNVGPKFDMIASATLTLEECSDGNFYLLFSNHFKRFLLFICQINIINV